MRRILLFSLLCLIPLCCAGCSAVADVPDTLVRVTGESLPFLPAEIWTYSGMRPLPEAWQENGMKPLPEEDWQDVTPPTLNGMGWQIIKSSHTCESLLVTQEGAYVLGMCFGGWGATSAVPCDADDNGMPDLLFTFSWGSGIHRSHLAVLNLTTQELTILATWWEWESDLVVLPPTARTESPLSSYAITDYPVWLAELDLIRPYSQAAPPFVPVRSIGSLTIDHSLALHLLPLEQLEITP